MLLHQDFHGGNVLRDADGWRAIDPKPLVGDPAFDGASLLRDRRWLLGEPGVDRDDRSPARPPRRALDLDRERLRLWGVVHALAWGTGRGGQPELIECARILAQRSDSAAPTAR